jgi:head-tail adaptor
MAEMGDYFPSLCTIQEDVGVADAHGVIVEDWQDVHVDIPCAHGPNKGTEIKQPDQTYVVSNYAVSLMGHYPGVTEKMRAVVSGVAYDILLVQSSSHGGATRLLVRKVT